MLKKITFCLFIFALLVGTGATLSAQTLQITTSSPAKGVAQLTGDTKLDIRNAAELTPEELKVALEKHSCGIDKVDKDPAFCAACTGAGCTGTCYRIPCGFYINAKDQLPAPPPAGFLSIILGCTTTVVSTCNDLSSTAPCQAAAITTAPNDNRCFNSSLLLQSVGCI